MKVTHLFLLANLALAGQEESLDLSVLSNEKTNIFYEDEVVKGDGAVAWTIRVVNRTASERDCSIRWRVVDYYGNVRLEGRMSGRLAAGASEQPAPARSSIQKVVRFKPAERGCFGLVVEVEADEAKIEKRFNVGVVPRPRPGLCPLSMFGTNNPWYPDAAERMERIGMKIARYHFGQDAIQPRKGVWDYKRMDEAFEHFKDHGIVMMPILGYAAPWDISEPPPGFRKAYGPPGDYENWAEFVYRTVARYSRYCVGWEVWNEPWIRGWTWHDTAAEFRKFLRVTYESAKKADPNALVICGHSASFLNDIILVGDGKLLDSDSNHPYKTPPPEEVFLKYTDYGIQVAAAAGLQPHWITEEGDMVPFVTQEAFVNNIVRKHALAAMLGIRAIMWHELGGGEEPYSGMGLFNRGNLPKPAAVAYAVLAHFAEGKFFRDDIFRDLTSVWGILLSDADDREKLVVLWSTAGHARLRIAERGDIRAYSVMGNPTGRVRGERLDLALSEEPIYLLSSMDRAEIIRLLRGAELSGIEPVVLWIQPVAERLDQRARVMVKVQDRLNRPVKGELRIEPPDGIRMLKDRAVVTLRPGETQEVSFQTQTAATRPENRYPFTVRFEGQDGRTARTQLVSETVALRGKVTVDADLSDWADAVKVRLDSTHYHNPDLYTEAMLDPRKKLPEPGEKYLSAACALKWDESHLYFSAEVKDPRHNLAATGDPDDYEFFWNGDSIQLGFGFSDRTEWDRRFNKARNPTEPFYWKGNFFDVDYQYAIGLTPKGPRCVRLEAPGMAWRVYYPTSPNPGYGVMNPPEALVAVVRDEDSRTTRYELGLPWAELKLMKPASGKLFRFSFIINDGDGTGRIQWGKLAGMWPWLQNSCSFHPTWNSDVWSCQTLWGLADGR